MTANGIDRTGVVGGSGGTRASFVDAFLDADTFADAYDALDLAAFALTLPVYDPVGVYEKDVFDNSMNVYQASGETTRFAAHIWRSADNTGAHTGNEYSVAHFEYRPKGSGTNGPTHADYGLTISAIKQSFDTTSVVGEVDGMSIVVRNGGAGSDSAGILTNVATQGTGFMAAMETQTSIIDAYVITKQIQTQVGVCDNVNATYVGFFARVNVGALGEAYRADTETGTSWAYLFRGFAVGVEKFNVTGTGQINLFDSSGNKKTLRCSVNAFSVVDNAGTSEIFNLSDAGALSVSTTLSGSQLIVIGAAGTASAGTIRYGATTAATASAGAAGAPPAQVAGYIIVNVAGTQMKIPYYAN